MKKIYFSAKINAPKQKVWEMLWDIDTYRIWTSAFTEGSDVKTDNWNEGSKVLFLDDKGGGMVSMVAANRKNEHMSFRHLGIIKNGIEDTSSDIIKVWAGATENYHLSGNNGTTTLLVDMDITEDFKDYMEKTWPVALEKIKALAEGKIKIVISISLSVNAPVSKVWEYWTSPKHITEWNHASDDWHCPKSENDLQPGGKFSSTMAAKDGSFSFNFCGTHNEVEIQNIITSTLGDGRKMKVKFEENDGQTSVSESFEAETINSLELQRNGWQAILNNFKKHTETN
ncbi:MAG TPA: SRPBCC domain-containing protein [Chitinophagaceae bacterium]|nr:SRPBCC domain-containing protein [Chitinophagaceae bacterium]